MTHDDPTIARMHDAIEYTRWQNLAIALNDLTTWGANPFLALEDQLAEHLDPAGITVLDPAEDHHTYRLRYRPPYGDERGTDHGPGWIVEHRKPNPLAPRYRCSRGHYLPADFTPPAADPDTWDDTCRCNPAA
ncbi:hypothetical protein ACIQMY_25460 [Streptomyces sp. NPDC091368]|uniref:hypothetical protein n=1 Tax=Streptomyces sp. NPDC091368 TaxID=3365993 RepID=UPI00381126F1